MTWQRQSCPSRNKKTANEATISVPGCAASAKCSYLCFHTFPKNGGLWKKWLIHIQQNWFHFIPDDLIKASNPDGRWHWKDKLSLLSLFEWNKYSIPAVGTNRATTHSLWWLGRADYWCWMYGCGVFWLLLHHRTSCPGFGLSKNEDLRSEQAKSQMEEMKSATSSF